ncbi:hypothetical protein GOP47_0014605 [Adiantum capillus-veneris]|uniref:RNA helicase n=1 Tax=Adiantum capillus-veneris TaxID=13818 RepID=A0A9D4UM41_ADICA|nr:hypothetical protein GOP47_0014605 [Adiantum capillus-veneris]
MASQFWKPGAERPPLLTDEDDGLFVMAAQPYYSSGYMTIERQRQTLPAFKHRTPLLYLIENHATTIVIGETGSGKTTQIPQYLVEGGWSEGGRLIACTQPRRIAVQTVAARVAEEMHVTLGQEVGYSIRFEDMTTPGVTKIKYLTDGVLLREMMEDPLLVRYSVIMVDEAHERSISTDILLGLLKKVQRRRPELRLIIASATLEARSIAAFFDTSAERRSQSQAMDLVFPSRKPAILSIEGKTFTVQIFYTEEPVSDYVRDAVSTVNSIHKLEPPGDILVFMTGQDEVDETVQLIQHETENRHSDLVALPLYAGLARVDQEHAFGPIPRGKRKVIVATNIAETSLTLEGIVYVVDSGFSKQRFYNPIKDVEALITAPISRASAQQRAGRAGRVRPGKCYRLYTEDDYTNLMSAETVPEIQRSNLTSTILQLKALGIDSIMRFDWLASPAPEAMVRALETIFAIGAIDSDAKLTSPTGFQIAEIPLHPMLGKTLIASCALGCALEMVTIAAALSVQSIWVPSRGRQKELDEAKLRFAASEGDHITYLNVFEGFLQSQRSAQWCHRNLINYQALKKVEDIRSHLSKLLQRLGLAVKSCERDIKVIQKAIVAGFFANACQLKISVEQGCYKRIRDGEEVFIHPSSVLFRVSPKWIIYHANTVTERHYVREITVIESPWLMELAPHFFHHKSMEY